MQGSPAAPLQDRQDGCDLVGSNGAHFDQLAVSGAPSIDNKWTGSDSDCRYPHGIRSRLTRPFSLMRYRRPT